MASRPWATLGLVALLAGCGDSDPSPGKKAPAPRAVCGYAATATLPTDVAQVLPGRPAVLTSENLADGGSHVTTLVDLRFRPAFDTILRRAASSGWTVEDRERENTDAELELTRDAQRMSLRLSLPHLPGCVATRADVVFTPQG